jgi:glycosyltransferase involved in cell wall biosynthesis
MGTEERLRVVHLFKDYYPPTTGGIEQHMDVLCRHQAASADVTVLVPARRAWRSEERAAGVRVIRLPEFGRWVSSPVCPTAPWELRKLRPDLVHLHFPNPMGDLAYLLARVSVPCVVSYHADVVRQRRLLPAYTPVLRALLRRVRRVIVSADENLRAARLLDGHREKCTVIPYGIELDAFVPRPADLVEIEALRERLGPRIVLFLGAARYYKGIEVLLRAMTQTEGHLLVAGRGTDCAAWRGRAEALGIAKRVTFCGEVSDAGRRRLYNACDVFVLPSVDRSESFGIAQLEAMACGKPVISSDLPTGIRAVNKHGVTGVLVPPGDASALARALDSLLSDPARRAALGAAARDRVRAEFSADQMVARTWAVYDAALAG